MRAIRDKTKEFKASNRTYMKKSQLPSSTQDWTLLRPYLHSPSYSHTVLECWGIGQRPVVSTSQDASSKAVKLLPSISLDWAAI